MAARRRKRCGAGDTPTVPAAFPAVTKLDESPPGRRREAGPETRAARVPWQSVAAGCRELHVENPDILATLAKAGGRRPRLVIGFAAETEKVVEHAQAKRARKGCDWILANDVSPATGTFGGERNRIHLVDEGGVEDWPLLSKREVAERLARRIAERLGGATA